MIKLYGFSSPNVMKVLIMFEETGLEHEVCTVNVYAKEQYSAEFGHLTPNRKVPVIVDENGPDGRPFTLWESGAILIYLAEKTGQFLPAAPRERHTVLQWLMFQVGGVGPMFGQANHFRGAAPPGNVYGWIRYVSEVKRLFGVLETRLGESRYLGGDDYSIADIATYPWARYYEAHDVDLKSLPNVSRWMGAITERSAVKTVLGLWASHYWDFGVARRAAASADELDRFFGRGVYAKVTEEDYKRYYGRPYPRSVAGE